MGKDNALLETRKNFDAAESIQIDVLATYGSSDTVATELKTTVDGIEELYAVDVNGFNSDAKIESIRAYLGRRDN